MKKAHFGNRVHARWPGAILLVLVGCSTSDKPSARGRELEVLRSQLAHQQALLSKTEGALRASHERANSLAAEKDALAGTFQATRDALAEREARAGELEANLAALGEALEVERREAEALRRSPPAAEHDRETHSLAVAAPDAEQGRADRSAALDSGEAQGSPRPGDAAPALLPLSARPPGATSPAPDAQPAGAGREPAGLWADVARIIGLRLKRALEHDSTWQGQDTVFLALMTAAFVALLWAASRALCWLAGRRRQGVAPAHSQPANPELDEAPRVAAPRPRIVSRMATARRQDPAGAGPGPAPSAAEARPAERALAAAPASPRSAHDQPKPWTKERLSPPVPARKIEEEVEEMFTRTAVISGASSQEPGSTQFIDEAGGGKLVYGELAPGRGERPEEAAGFTQIIGREEQSPATRAPEPEVTQCMPGLGPAKGRAPRPQRPASQSHPAHGSPAPQGSRRVASRAPDPNSEEALLAELKELIGERINEARK